MSPRTLLGPALGIALVGCGGTEGAGPADAGRADVRVAADAGAVVDVPVAEDAPTDAGAEPVDVEPAPDVPPAEDVPAVDGGACPARAATPGDTERRVTVGGVERVYRVHIPRSYDPTRPAMVVLNFHGYLSNEAQQADWSNLNEASDTRGFIAVHPRGIDSSWNAGLCCGNARTRNVDDVGFVRAMLDALPRELCVDPRRVFATGFSNGGFFSHRLACELSDRIAAIAPVSGVMGMPTCAPPRPVPVLHFHGDADIVVPYGGSAIFGYQSVNDSMRGWVTRDGCGAAGTQILQRGDARCVSFAGCAGGAEAILCTLAGGGHTWPGGDVSALGGRTSRDLDATTYLLDFFERHPMP